MQNKPKIEATLNVPQQGHPDPEGRMAKSELYRAAKMSMKLFQMIQDGQQLEAWVQAKITKSADYLDSIYHYMEYQAKFGAGASAATVDDITNDLPSQVDEPEEAVEIDESWTYEEKLQALLEAKMKKCNVEGFEAGAKPGATKKTATGTLTKTATGVRHTRDKFEYDPGSDDKDDKKMKRNAKKKEVKEAIPSFSKSVAARKPAMPAPGSANKLKATPFGTQSDGKPVQPGQKFDTATGKPLNRPTAQTTKVGGSSQQDQLADKVQRMVDLRDGFAKRGDTEKAKYVQDQIRLMRAGEKYDDFGMFN